MKVRLRISSTWPVLIVGWMAITLGSGCTGSVVDPEAAAVRQRVLLATQAGESTTISDARLSVLDSAIEPKTAGVTVIGTIDANGHDPWERNLAAFVIMDASDKYIKLAQAHNHDDGDCPFCKHKSDINQFTAIIQIANDKGAVIPRNARDLLGLKSKQKVTVSGKATINELDMLVVMAESISVQGQP